MTAVPGAPGPLRLVLLLLLVLSSSPRRGPPGSPAVASISVRSRIMGTLQVTTWQLWGIQLKTGWMKHNKDADGPVPDQRFLRIIEDSDTFRACPRFAPGLASPVPVRSVATITTHYGQFAALPGGEVAVVRRAARSPPPPIIGKNQNDICGGERL